MALSDPKEEAPSTTDGPDRRSPPSFPFPSSRDISPTSSQPDHANVAPLSFHFLELREQTPSGRFVQLLPRSTNQSPTGALRSPSQNKENVIAGPAAPPAQQRPPLPAHTPSSSESGRQRGQTVSFSDGDLSERSRRFTISAQPLAVNLAMLRQSLSAQLPVRKTSVTYEPGPSRNNSLLAMHAPHRDISLMFGSHAPSRVESPTLPEGGSVHSPPESVRFSPSPPPAKPVLATAIPLAASTLAEKPVSGSRRGSRQGSESNAVPISILRKSSTKKSNKTIVASPVGPPVPFQQYLTKEDDRKLHVLLACTGSVATIKVPLIVDKLFQIFGPSKISVQLVVTKAASHFLRGLKIHKDVKIWRDEDEWANFTEWHATTTTASTLEPHMASKKQKNPYEKMILHNELRKWADIMLIAPLSANTLAKLANGLSDNLLTSIVRCWGPGACAAPTSAPNGQKITKKPILVAPAMNTFMYTHPLTSKQLKILTNPDEGFGMEVLKPVEKVLVCGDIGMGGMREWLDVVECLRRKIKLVLAERAEDGLDIPIEENDEDEKEEDRDDEDDESDDEEDDAELELEDDSLDVDDEPATDKQKEGDGLIFELSGDLSGQLSEIQRTMSPLSMEAQSII